MKSKAIESSLNGPRKDGMCGVERMRLDQIGRDKQEPQREMRIYREKENENRQRRDECCQTRVNQADKHITMEWLRDDRVRKKNKREEITE